jgi:hypothetical protein
MQRLRGIAGAAAIDQIENIVLEKQLAYEFERLNPLNGIEAAERLN